MVKSNVHDNVCKRGNDPGHTISDSRDRNPLLYSRAAESTAALLQRTVKRVAAAQNFKKSRHLHSHSCLTLFLIVLFPCLRVVLLRLSLTWRDKIKQMLIMSLHRSHWRLIIYWQFCHATISIPPNLYKNLNLTIMRIMVWLKHSLKIKLALRLSNFSMFKCNIYKQGWAIWPQKINNFSYQSISVIITINDDSLFLSSSKSLQSKSCWNQLIVVVNYFVRMTKTCQTGEYFTNLT